ncbi:MAG: PDZ domain-containing protein [Oscillospiraceae bacterium]
MSTIITSVDRHSPAERAGIAAGEQLLTINGHEIIDVLDYRFYGYDTDCRLGCGSPPAPCGPCPCASPRAGTWA